MFHRGCQVLGGGSCCVIEKVNDIGDVDEIGSDNGLGCDNV